MGRLMRSLPPRGKSLDDKKAPAQADNPSPQESFGEIPAASLLRNTSFSYVAFGLDTLILLALTPFIIRMLGVDQYGVWALLWSVVALSELVHLGMAEAVVKFIATARGQDDVAGHRQIVAALFWGYVAQGTVIALLTAGVYANFSGLFTNVPAEYEGAARTSLLILGGSAALRAPLSVFDGILLAHQRQWKGFAIQVLTRAIQAVLTVVLLGAAPDLVTLSLLNAGATLAQFLVITVVVAQTIPALSIRPGHVQRARLKDIYAFSLHFTLITAAFLLATRVDSFIIERWLDVKSIGIYALALRVTTAVDALVTRAQRMLTPVYAELHGKGDQEVMVSHLMTSSRLTFALAVPMAGGLMVLARPLLVTWVGDEMAEGDTVLIVLLASVMTASVYEGVRGLLSMIGQHKVLARAIFVGQLLNVLLSIVLVQRFGLLGVAAGTVLGMLPMDIFVFQRTLTKEVGVSALDFLKATVVPSLLPGIVALGALTALCRVLPPTSLALVAVYGIVMTLLFGFLYWKLGATDSDRELLRGNYQAIRRRLPGGA